MKKSNITSVSRESFSVHTVLSQTVTVCYSPSYKIHEYQLGKITIHEKINILLTRIDAIFGNLLSFNSSKIYNATSILGISYYRNALKTILRSFVLNFKAIELQRELVPG